MSNEGPGYLIDNLIAAGLGNSGLYNVLVELKPSSGGVISDEFLATLRSCPTGSEVFTAPLNNYTGINNPVGINADGTLTIVPIFGTDYFGKEGYSTYPETQPGEGRELFTYATGPEYYLDAGSSGNGNNYKAFAIAWSNSSDGIPVSETNEATLSIYPNPFTDGFLINNLKGLTRIEVYDILGQLCFQTKTGGGGFIYLSSLPYGVYWLKIFAGNGIKHQKIVKQQ